VQAKPYEVCGQNVKPRKSKPLSFPFYYFFFV
jgi:hypothetical protein